VRAVAEHQRPSDGGLQLDPKVEERRRRRLALGVASSAGEAMEARTPRNLRDLA
jgi:hypothetical protein